MAALTLRGPIYWRTQGGDLASVERMVSIGGLLLGPPHRLGIGPIDPIRADAGFADFLKH